MLSNVITVVVKKAVSLTLIPSLHIPHKHTLYSMFNRNFFSSGLCDGAGRWKYLRRFIWEKGVEGYGNVGSGNCERWLVRMNRLEGGEECEGWNCMKGFGGRRG